MRDPVLFTYCPCPLGPLLLAGTGDALEVIGLPRGGEAMAPRPDWTDAPGAFAVARRQLSAYFAGELREFRLELRPAGTPFQQSVWTAVSAIPYGTTRSYREIAESVRRPLAVRAVGLANGRNPLPIVVPCHRVIGSNGTLTGYGGGLEMKRWLLDLERAPRLAFSAPPLPPSGT